MNEPNTCRGILTGMAISLLFYLLLLLFCCGLCGIVNGG